ncbi:MAG TPA: GNA1162 family protein [Anaeromyxobacter sp.]
MTRRTRSLAMRCALLVAAASGCASSRTYHDRNMDFGSVKTVAVLPLQNLSKEPSAAEQVRDTLFSALLASGGVYAVPPGEVSRAVARVGMATPWAPTVEEATRLGAMLKVDALITGVVREFGEVRGTGGSAPVVTVSAQLIETSSGKVVWSGSTSRGGLTLGDRLLGTGGRPTNGVTEDAVHDLLLQLFQ